MHFSIGAWNVLGGCLAAFDVAHHSVEHSMSHRGGTRRGKGQEALVAFLSLSPYWTVFYTSALSLSCNAVH